MAHTQPSPTGGVTPHHAHIAAAHAQVNGHLPLQSQTQKAPALNTAQKIAALNEQVWLQIGMCLVHLVVIVIYDISKQRTTCIDFLFKGSLTELMGDLDGAMNAYEQALRHNQWSIPAMNAISCILRTKEQFPKAIEYLQNILKLDPTSGETWGSLGMLRRCASFGIAGYRQLTRPF